MILTPQLATLIERTRAKTASDQVELKTAVTPSMRHSIEDIYDEHVWRIYGFFAYRTGDREDAEDLTQLTFERAVKALDRFDEHKAGMSTWLFTIANNLLIDHHRRRAVRPVDPMDPSVLAQHGGTEDPFDDLGLDPALATALAKLSDREREILALRYGAELTGPEIAEMKELSLANVQQIHSRALRKMRATMETPA